MNRVIGVLLVVVSAVLVGVNPVLAKIVYRDGVDPLSFIFIRFAISTMILLVIMRSRRVPWPGAQLCRSLVGLGVWGMCGTTLCYFYALSNASPGLVTVIVFCYPALVAILSAVFLKRRLNLLSFTALVLTLGGIIIIIGPSEGGHTTGILLSMCAAIFFAAYVTFGSVRIRQAGFLPAATIVSCSATVVLGVGVLIRGISWPTTSFCWFLIAGNAVTSSVVARLAFNAGLERIEASSAAMLSTMELVVAVGLSVVFLGEVISGNMVAGAAMILGATLLLTHMEMRAVRTAPMAALLDDTVPAISTGRPADASNKVLTKGFGRNRAHVKGAA